MTITIKKDQLCSNTLPELFAEIFVHFNAELAQISEMSRIKISDLCEYIARHIHDNNEDYIYEV